MNAEEFDFLRSETSKIKNKFLHFSGQNLSYIQLSQNLFNLFHCASLFLFVFLVLIKCKNDGNICKKIIVKRKISKKTGFSP